MLDANFTGDFPDEPSPEQVMEIIEATKRLIIEDFNLATATPESTELVELDARTDSNSICLKTQQIVVMLQNELPEKWAELIYKELFIDWLICGLSRSAKYRPK